MNLNMPYLKYAWSLALIAGMTFFVCNAQDPASLDLSFNPDDTGNGAVQWYEQPYSILVPMPDGRLIAGWPGGPLGANPPNPIPNTGGYTRIVRFDQNGWLDTTYHTDVTYSLTQLALQADGKLLVAREYYEHPQIIRLNADGSQDTTFNSTAEFTGGSIKYLKVMANNDILVGGNFSEVSGIPRRLIARLDPDGALLPAPYANDPGVPAGIGIGQTLYAMAVLTDDRVVACGVSNVNNTRCLVFTADGHFESQSILPSNWLNNMSGSYLAGTPDGGYLYLRHENGYHDDCHKVNADGTLDTTFYVAFDGAPNGTRVQAGLLPNGNILFTGAFNFAPPNKKCHGLLVTDPAGNIQDEFQTDDLIAHFYPLVSLEDRVSAQAITQDGRIILSGKMLTHARGAYANGMVRLLGNGRFDPSFRHRTAANGPVNCAAIQPDGRILLGGAFTTYNGHPSRYLVRVHDDGSLDTSFHVGRGTGAQVHALLLNTDGTVLVGMDCATQNAYSMQANFYDLDSTASLFLVDPEGAFIRSIHSWTTPPYTCESIQAIERMPNGGALAVGSGITRLDADLFVDNSYNNQEEQWFDRPLLASQTISDGRTYIGGSFNYFMGSATSNLARVTSTGTLDPWAGIHIEGTFDLDGEVLDLEPLASGTAIMVCGRIRRAYGSLLRQGLLQMTTNGVVTTFNSGFAYSSDDFCHRIKQLPNGNYLIGGRFSTYGGESHNDLVRTDWLGVVDTTFDAQGGLEPDADYNVRVLDVDASGRYLVAGDFQSYQGIGRNFVLRLTGTSIPTGVASTPPAVRDGVSAYIRADGYLMLGAGLATMDLIEVFDPMGRLVMQGNPRSSSTGMDASHLSEGMYLIRGTRKGESLSTRLMYNRQ